MLPNSGSLVFERAIEIYRNLAPKQMHFRLFTPRLMDTVLRPFYQLSDQLGSNLAPGIEQETSIALATASCLTSVSFKFSKEEIREILVCYVGRTISLFAIKALLSPPTSHVLSESPVLS